ncbi:nucleoside triphosphate hydrolase [Candidatus Woesearchaeota archaeon]|nr:NUDIX hydrolase [Candidatus Woesearchaeota archaeon]RLE42861.1 MAG: nucleoside triphosphate hydrolase [Candidatus Woesearchaeota archaeon]
MKTDLVVAGYLIHRNKVLLIKHKKIGKWLPPGGHIEPNETPDEALKREIKEELNLDIEILNTTRVAEEGNIKQQLAVPFYVNVHSVGSHDHCCLFYICKPKNPEQIALNQAELDGYKWFTKEELKQVPVDVKNIALKAFEVYEWLTQNESR